MTVLITSHRKMEAAMIPTVKQPPKKPTVTPRQGVPMGQTPHDGRSVAPMQSVPARAAALLQGLRRAPVPVGR